MDDSGSELMRGFFRVFFRLYIGDDYSESLGKGSLLDDFRKSLDTREKGMLFLCICFNF